MKQTLGPKTQLEIYIYNFEINYCSINIVFWEHKKILSHEGTQKQTKINVSLYVS